MQLWIPEVNAVCKGFGSLPWRLTWRSWTEPQVSSSRRIRWRLCLLSWISASPTRRRVVTATRTGLPHRSVWVLVISLQPLTLLYLLCGLLPRPESLRLESSFLSLRALLIIRIEFFLLHWAELNYYITTVNFHYFIMLVISSVFHCFNLEET